tara:strand:+ start:274 stop:2235 length:1962 start_codon:yes stop_codon:yes gene_type:complete
MRLKKLHLKNFKGIPEFTLEAQPGNTEIWGDNATGKTTIFDGFTWLLFGKDSLGSAKFEIKSLDLKGEAAHGLEHTVEAVLDLGEKELKLKKVYKEKYPKKRGTAKHVFTGHTTKHFVDGVPINEKGYKEAINNICDEDAFRLLSNPRYFNEGIHWQERRKVLLEVCGDISDADVVASDKDLKGLPDILGTRTLEDHRKVIASRRQEINKELDKIPVRIDEIGASAVEAREKLAVEKDLKAAQSDIKTGKETLAEIEAGGNVAVLKTQVREIENKISAIDNAHADRVLSAKREHKERILDLSDASVEATKAVELAVKMKTDLETALEKASDAMEAKQEEEASLRKAWFKEYESELVFKQDENCPTCSQALPEDQLKTAKEKATQDFNQEKAENLAAIDARGKVVVNAREDAAKEAAGFAEEIAKTDLLIHSATEASRIAVEALIVAKGESETAYAEDPEKKRLEKEKLMLEKQIEADSTFMADETSDTREAIDQLETRIRGYQAELLQIEANARIEARITELSDQERKLAAEFEELERQLFLSEQFVRTKVAMLEEKINAKFELARWKLFEEQINEGLRECCEVMTYGVPYNSMNNAARINIGLDICNTLAAHYGIQAPIFIDNSEAVSELLETDAQQIKLIVSAQHQSLEIA